ncbi:MAG: iron-containing alcohol dehydrogenase [Chloroflexi bacterium]|nr:iron-containing alcohol dehydrogenase [Chloroflexota bacterium]
MSHTLHCPTKLIFSDDAGADLVREVGGLPSGRALVVTDPGIVNAGIAAPLTDALNQSGRDPEVFTEIPSNPGVSDVRAAVAAARGIGPAIIVASGGGSAIDVAKAVGLLLAHDGDDWEDFQWGRTPVTRESLPTIAIPTTAGTGSEASHVAVIGDRSSFKKGLVHPTLFPRVAIVDAKLTLSLPPSLTAATGMDALTHALEAYLGKRANPSSDLFALAALRNIVRWLSQATHQGDNVNARREMAQAAAWAGIAMDHAGLGLCHALCGPLSARYRVHHGLGNALLLPAVLDFNAEAIPAARWPALRDALSLTPGKAKPHDLATWARDFVARLGLPTNLRAIGVDAMTFDAMAEEATRMAMIANNCRPAGAAECLAVLKAAL